VHSALLDSFLNENIVKPLGILCATSPEYPTPPLNMVTCTPTKKARIMQLRKQGWKFKDIGNEIGLESSVVSRNYNKLIKKGPHPDLYHHEPIPGRPKIITPHAERRAVRLITSGECRDATDVQRVLFPRLHPTTVRQMFIRKGMPGRIRRKKPWLSRKHVSKRNMWAISHHRRREFFWRKVWYSDEKKFNLFGSDGKQYCRRRPGEEFLERNVRKVVKHGGGSLMVWGCISWNGPGRLHRVEGNMDAHQYTLILSKSFLGSLDDKKVRSKNIIFQQDNDPEHTSKLAQKWFAENKIKVLTWPPNSPDQNIMEHVWDYVDHKIRARPQLPRNIEELWTALQEEWGKIDRYYIRKLYRSIPNRVDALVHSKGLWTRY